MNKFTLVQNQSGKELILSPTLNGCNIGLTPYPNTGESNYEDVDDPQFNPDDDITYVHSDATNTLYDLYDIENHTSETGTINYVQIFSRAKSNLFAPHKDAIYKILLDDNSCAATKKSDNIELVTTYSKYSNVWNTNPFTGVAFTWANIDNYQIGVECSSPAVTAYLTGTMRPHSVGNSTDWTPHEGTAQVSKPNWRCVDEEAANGLDDYVMCMMPDAIDEYHTSTVALGGATVTSVTVFGTFIAAGENYSSSECVKLRVRTGGASHESGWFGANSVSWTKHAYTWKNNPTTGVAWTQADIDSLEIGIHGKWSVNHEVCCTQLYAVVYYTKTNATPDIRTTQIYAKVNYDEEVTCDLNMPEEISQDYVHNIKMINHWSGNRSVFGVCRRKDTTVMLGYEIEDSDCTDVCARLKCIENMGKSGHPLTLSGFCYADYNDEYLIRSWGWKKISGKPTHFAWIIELERCS